MNSFVNASEAACILGVSKATLYAYVSRGLVKATSVAKGRRSSQYNRQELEFLSRQHGKARKPDLIAKESLSWGLPVLESGLTLIQNGELYYRGQPVSRLAETCSAEDVASLLWGSAENTLFSSEAPFVSPLWENTRPLLHHHRFASRAAILFAMAQDSDDSALWQDPLLVARRAADLLRLMVASLLGVSPQATPLHEQFATAWGLNAAEAQWVRIALVVSADHELNASSFTARCVASTQASPGAAVLGGFAALTGALHGAATDRVEAFWDEISAQHDVAAAIEHRLKRGEVIPGFGHPLYPKGDPRAQAIFKQMHPDGPSKAIIEAVEKQTGYLPSIDVALVVLRRRLACPPGGAFALFAAGRSIGWLAHILEQYQQGQLIRPRAEYTGCPPVVLNKDFLFG